MLPYWISLALSIAFLYASRTQPLTSLGEATASRTALPRYAMWGVVASALVLILLTGFRYGIGQDYFYTYVPYFERVRAGFNPPDMEIGFFALNWVVSRFTSDPTPIFFICSVIFFICVYATVLKESACVPLSIFLIFGMSYIFIFMNAMRQMTAVAILLFSLRYIEERNIVSFGICIALAWLFHASSVIFVVMYWLPYVRLSLTACVVVPLAVLLLRGPLSDMLTYLISQTSYAGYIGSVFDTGETGSINTLMNITVLLFSAAVPWAMGESYSKQYNLLLWCQLLCACIALMTGAIPLAQRIRWVFALPSILLVPNALECVGNKGVRFLVGLVIIISYILYIYITIGMWNGNGVVPYQSVFLRVL